MGRAGCRDYNKRREEFRQLLRSYGRFYSFLAQVVQLGDPWLEKLYAYTSWLVRLLPNREVPPDITITDDMLRLKAFKVAETGGPYDASLQPGEREKLQPITSFGANPYTEDEERSLSEIIAAFNERHGTEFSKEDFLRFEVLNEEILETDNMAEMMRNNPADVVFDAYAEAFIQGAIRMFQRDREMHNIILTDAEAREKAIRHFFNRALRAVKESA